MSNYPAGAEFDSSAPWNTPESVIKEPLYECAYYMQITKKSWEIPSYYCVKGVDYDYKVIHTYGGESIEITEIEDEPISYCFKDFDKKYKEISKDEFETQLNKVLCKLED